MRWKSYRAQVMLIFTACISLLFECNLKSEKSAPENEEVSLRLQEPVTYTQFVETCAGFMNLNQYSELLEFCKVYREKPPIAPEDSSVSGKELVDYYIVSAASVLQRKKLLISEGESFLEKYPQSIYYSSVKQLLKAAGVGHDFGTELLSGGKITSIVYECDKSQEKWPDLCNYDIAMKYYTDKQYSTALTYFSKSNLGVVAEMRGVALDVSLFVIFNCYYSLEDKKGATEIINLLEQKNPSSDRLASMRQMAELM